MEVVAALAGAVVGALVAYFLNANIWEPRKAREETRRLAAALLAEAKTWKELYWELWGNEIGALRPGEPLGALVLVPSHNLLVVYDNNADKLGLFPQAKIQLIVRSATLTKAYLEILKQQHLEISRWTDLMHETARAGMREASKNMEQLRDQLRVDAADTLRKQSGEMLKALDSAIKALEEYVGAAARGDL